MATETARGLLIVFSGPSGCGKGTVVAEILKQRSDTVLSVSVTTRSPRPGEIDGVHYSFISKSQFEQMIGDNALLEYAQYSGNYYGTPRAAVEQQLGAGKNVILEIDVQGALKVMAGCDDYLSVFLAVPSMDELEHRLRGRATEDEAHLQARLQAASFEMAHSDRYQHVIVNDTVADTVRQLNTIIETEKMRRSRNNLS